MNDRLDPYWLGRLQAIGKMQARYLWLLVVASVFYFGLSSGILRPTNGDVKVPVLNLELGVGPILAAGPFILSFFVLVFIGALKAYSRASEKLDLRGEAGWLQATPGNVVSHDHIAARILELGRTYQIREVAYDPWGGRQLAARLINDGVPMVELAQTLAHLSPAAKELERLLLSRQLRHGNHPILSWCAGNVVVDVDANGNIRPSKRRSTERIDGISALVTRWPEWRQRRRFDLYTRIAELSRWHDRTHSHHTHHGGKHVAKGNPKSRPTSTGSADVSDHAAAREPVEGARRRSKNFAEKREPARQRRALMFSSKLRIRFVKGVGFADGTARDPREVAEYAVAEAMEHVTTGRAELAPDAPIGRAASTIPERACWSCGGTGQSFATGC